MWPMFAAVLPAAVVIALIYMRGQFGWLAWPFVAASAIFGFYAWRLYDVEGAERSFVRASIAALCMYIAVLGVVVPLMRPVFPSRGLAELIANSGCRNPVVASAGFHEPSLVFLAGTRTRLVDGASAAEILRQGDCRARGDRIAPRPRLRAARRADRPALQPARPARQQLQHQWRAVDHLRDLSLGAAAVSHEHRSRRRTAIARCARRRHEPRRVAAR